MSALRTRIINASAGSGKTYRLAVAYLRALLQPLPDGTHTLPQQVLATTFTRAAASEILERVLRRLALAVVSGEERQRLLAEIERPELGRDDLVRLLESVCQVLPQLQIGTLDALFARIVRVMGLDLAFPPSWEVAGEMRSAQLALAAADRMLRGAEMLEAREQWRHYAQFKPGIQVRAALVDLLEHNRFLLIDLPRPPEGFHLDEPSRFLPADIEQLNSALGAFEPPLTKAGTPHAVWVKALGDIRALVAGGSTLVSMLEGSLLVRAASQPAGKFGRVDVPGTLRDILSPWTRRAREDLQRLHHARLPALAALAQRYHVLRHEVAYAGGTYTFREIEAAVWTLPEPLLSDLYFRLDGRIQHLLLDEFQDTSISQFRFLWPIIAEVRAGGRLFFAVGDVKQSIYGWRGADRHLLTRLPDWLDPQHLDADVTPEQIADNYRSSPAVLSAVNRLFENLDEAECLHPETYTGSATERARVRRQAAASFLQNYRTHTARGANRHLAGRVRLLLTASISAEGEDDETPPEIETTLQAVERHLREDARREIAILCRRRKLMPALIAALQARGVPASGEGGNPVADSAAVELVLSMLTWLDHPGHSLAREHVRLSGVGAVFGWTESALDFVLSRNVHIAILRKGLAAVISGWVRHGDFRRRGTRHDQVRGEQLVELARRWDATGGGRLSNFVSEVRAERVDNPASSRVRVMTIHGAKGLEFEAVIVADLESSGGSGDGPRLAVSMATPEEPPEVVLLPRAADAEWLGLQNHHDRHLQNQFEEDLSVLYVALTRAKSYLDVVVPASDKPASSLAGIIREKWDHRAAGEHLIEECVGQAQAQSAAAPVDVMGRDQGLWEEGRGVMIANLRPVPARMETVTPSGREGAGIVQLGLLLHSGNAHALARGTAVHALLSRIEWSTDLPAPAAWSRSIPEREADPETCRHAARELHSRLRDPQDKLVRVFLADAWLERWRDLGVRRLELWRERRFAAIIGQELMNGSFDRVVFGLDTEGRRVCATILDFKTDRFTDAAERAERYRFYQPQLDAYADAMHRLTGLAPGLIETELVWID